MPGVPTDQATNGEGMKQTDRPDNSQICSRDGCQHAFGLHYIANDGKTRGCAGSFEAQRDGTIPCDCTAFLISYEWPLRQTVRE
jgi:hypothetical protein